MSMQLSAMDAGIMERVRNRFARSVSKCPCTRAIAYHAIFRVLDEHADNDASVMAVREATRMHAKRTGITIPPNAGGQT